jgi:hypothetical protein
MESAWDKLSKYTDMRFTILIFSFTSGNARERYWMQQILKHFGFTRFAQNAYANINFDDAGLRTILKEKGLEDNAFLFSHADEDPGMTKRLIALWSPERIAESLERFAHGLKGFLDDTPLEGEALFCRFFYAGTAYYEHFTTRLPNIPEDRISDKTPLTRIEKLIADFQARHGERMIRYYAGINE